MAKTQNINQRMSIVTLAWPILVEILLRTALGTSDVFMLSGYSDKAVSAVGGDHPTDVFPHHCLYLCQ